MYASNRPTLGRRMLMTDEREITKDNIIQVVSKAFMEHQENVAEEVYLFEYERGNQPILNREKKIRSDLNATVVENNASKIVDVHLGYCFSNPITFVQRAKIEPTKKQKGYNPERWFKHHYRCSKGRSRKNHDRHKNSNPRYKSTGYLRCFIGTEPGGCRSNLCNFCFGNRLGGAAWQLTYW